MTQKTPNLSDGEKPQRRMPVAQVSGITGGHEPSGNDGQTSGPAAGPHRNAAQQEGQALTPADKLTIMERLRKRGSWDKAARYREEQRLRLRAEGKSRKEALEESWRLMREEFEPINQVDRKLLVSFCECPPRSSVAGIERDFQHFYSVIYRLVTFAAIIEPRFGRQAMKLIPSATARLEHEGLPDGKQSQVHLDGSGDKLVLWGLDNPVAFLELADGVLSRTLSRLPQDVPVAGLIRQELTELLELMPQLQETVNHHVPRNWKDG